MGFGGERRRRRAWRIVLSAAGFVAVASGVSWPAAGAQEPTTTTTVATVTSTTTAPAVVAGADGSGASSGAGAGSRLPKCGKTPSTRATFSLDAGSDTDIDFGAAREARTVYLYYDVVGCHFSNRVVSLSTSAPDRVDLRVLDPVLLTVDGQALVASEPEDGSPGIEAVSEIVGQQKIRVRVTVDPDDNETDAGTYKGQIEIVSRYGNRSSVPFEVTIRYANSPLVFFSIMVPVLLFGTVIVWAKTVMADPAEDEYNPRGYGRWLLRAGNVLAVVTGLVAARLVFGETFLGDPDWGSATHGVMYFWPITSAEWWALATVMATAFTGAFTVASVPGEAVRRSSRQAAIAGADGGLSAADFPESDQLTQSDNSPRPEDGPQEVDGEPLSQDPGVVY